MTSALAFLPLLTLLVGGVLALLLTPLRASLGQGVAVLSTAASLVVSVVGFARVVTHGPLRHDLGGWPPPVGIDYVLDPLSAFLVVLIAGIGLLVVVLPAEVGLRLRPGRGQPAYALILLLLAGLAGVALAGDLFHVFVFLEIYSLASYALVSLGGTKGTFAAFRYLLIGTLGGSLYLVGVGFVYFTTGSLNMADVASLLPEIGTSPSLTGALGLIVIGLAIKMALFPLHVWLPAAHSAAPPAIAALLAAVQVKVAIYALLRIVFGVFGEAFLAGPMPVTSLLAWFGGAGVVVGSVMAIRQADLKRLLAWSTVAQIGLIGIGVGVGSELAVSGALVHVAAHAAMKAALFLVAGVVLVRAGSTSLASLDGLGRRLPLTMIGFVVAILSMVGIPPTAGFFSKLLILRGTIEAGAYGLTAVVAVSSLLTAAYVVRLVERLFGRSPAEDELARPDLAGGDLGARITGPILVLTAVTLVAGLANLALVDALTPAVGALP